MAKENYIPEADVFPDGGRVMKNILCYILLAVGAGFAVKFMLDRRKCRTAREPVKLCLRPVKWKLSIER